MVAVQDSIEHSTSDIPDTLYFAPMTRISLIVPFPDYMLT